MLLSQHRKLEVTFNPKTATVYKLVDATCPSSAGGLLCQTVYGTYDLYASADEDIDAVYETYVNATQASIDEGKLQQKLEEVDTATAFIVEGAAELDDVIAISSLRNQDDPLTEFAATKDETGGGSDSGGEMSFIAIALVVAAFIAVGLVAAFAFASNTNSKGKSEEEDDAYEKLLEYPDNKTEATDKDHSEVPGVHTVALAPQPPNELLELERQLGLHEPLEEDGEWDDPDSDLESDSDSFESSVTDTPLQLAEVEDAGMETEVREVKEDVEAEATAQPDDHQGQNAANDGRAEDAEASSNEEEDIKVVTVSLEDRDATEGHDAAGPVAGPTEEDAEELDSSGEKEGMLDSTELAASNEEEPLEPSSDAIANEVDGETEESAIESQHGSSCDGDLDASTTEIPMGTEDTDDLVVASAAEGENLTESQDRPSYGDLDASTTEIPMGTEDTDDLVMASTAEEERIMTAESSINDEEIGDDFSVPQRTDSEESPMDSKVGSSTVSEASLGGLAETTDLGLAAQAPYDASCNEMIPQNHQLFTTTSSANAVPDEASDDVELGNSFVFDAVRERDAAVYNGESHEDVWSSANDSAVRERVNFNAGSHEDAWSSTDDDSAVNEDDQLAPLEGVKILHAFDAGNDIPRDDSDQEMDQSRGVELDFSYRPPNIPDGEGDVDSVTEVDYHEHDFTRRRQDD